MAKRTDGHAMDSQPLWGFQSIYRDLQAITNDKRRGDAFEKVVLYYLCNDPVWSKSLGLDDDPGNARLWADASDWRWSDRDLGTDILVQDAQGRLWAVQAKCWRNDRPITKDEINSFLADSNRGTVFQRILVSTSPSLVSNARRTIRGQEKATTAVLAQALYDSRITWPNSLASLLRIVDGHPQALPPREPREHQTKAIAEVTEAFLAGRSARGQLLMACGTGKTLVGQRVAENLGARSVLVLVPSLMLLGQTLRDWSADASSGENFEWLAVCSDSTVDRSNRDQSVEDLDDLGIPNVTTDPEVIETFLSSGQRGGANRRVIFSTYQSSDRVAQAIRNAARPLKFDLMICDEAHRMARVGSASQQGNFDLPLDDGRIPSTRRLFMTATPRVFSDHVKRQAQESGAAGMVFCMDDPKIFGRVLHEYSFRQAIRDDVLADYHVLGVVVTEPEVQALLSDTSFIGLRRRESGDLLLSDAATAATHVAIAKAMERRGFGVSSLITFHNTVRAARDFAHEHNYYREFLDLPDVHTGLVQGTDPAHKRFEKLQPLAGHSGPAIVSNARCLTEGIDIPQLDAVAFIEPRYSVIDIAQAVGRAIRKPSTGKRTGYVVVPIFVPGIMQEALASRNGESSDVDNLEALDEQIGIAFAPVIDVLQALRSIDGMLGEQIREFRVQRGAQGRSGKRSSGIISIRREGSKATTGSLPVTIDFRGLATRSPETNERLALPSVGFNAVDFANSLQVLVVDRILSRCSESWWEWLGQLAQFVDHWRRLPVETEQDSVQDALARWAQKQRMSHARGTLNVDRVRALEAINGWTWRVREDAWMRQFGSLVQFVDANGRLPLTTTDDEDESRIAKWCVKQRGNYHRGALSHERAAALQGISLWSWDPLEDQWQANYGALLCFVKGKGTLPKPHHKDATAAALGAWNLHQRALHRTGRLAAQKIALLEAVPGWLWKPHSDRWTISLGKLAEFIDVNGRYPSAAIGASQERSLAIWVETQRRDHRVSQLSKERAVQLEALPGWSWNPREVAWPSTFNDVEVFLAAHHRLPLTTSREERERRLAQWLVFQRSQHQKGQLTKEQVALVESLEGWSWSPQVDQWDARFEELRQFVAHHDRLPSRGGGSDERKLASWVHHQRSIYRSNSLADEQVTRLEGLQHWSWSPGDDAWARGLSEVEAFIARNGRLPRETEKDPEEDALGRWLGKLRSAHRRGKLDGDKTSRLEELQYWSWSPGDDAWARGLSEVDAFIARNGRLPRETADDPEEERLGRWIGKRRAAYRKGTLDADRAARLEQVPEWTW